MRKVECGMRNEMKAEGGRRKVECGSGNYVNAE
jgi:hypothetical protein